MAVSTSARGWPLATGGKVSRESGWQLPLALSFQTINNISKPWLGALPNHTCPALLSCWKGMVLAAFCRASIPPSSPTLCLGLLPSAQVLLWHQPSPKAWISCSLPSSPIPQVSGIPAHLPELPACRACLAPRVVPATLGSSRAETCES